VIWPTSSGRNSWTREKTMNDLFKKYPQIVVDRLVKGKHFKYYLRTPSGPQILIVSRTTSDARAMKNNESLLRRWNNEN